MNNKTIHTIVIGGLNTDIVALGANKILRAGEYTYAKTLKIGPGGKSRNIAQMLATIVGKNKVAMVGKTSKDPFGLWKPPIEALKMSGVNIDSIKIESFEKTQQYPAIALIPVDKDGRNQIYVLPGITESFSSKDIDNSNQLFDKVKNNNGYLILSLELPLKTAIYSIKKANKLGIKALLDPGGMDEESDYAELLSQKIFLIKPNEHEVKTLTGITVDGFETAKKAAKELIKKGTENVFITIGEKGGYLFSNTLEVQVPIPKINLGSVKDETGCGDQTIAALAAALIAGKNITDAAKIGILAGSLQFSKAGIIPVTKEELSKYL